ncbi:MAG: 4'-phosphopantetheinyl transferase superfamily protein [Ruminococcus sp.]|nr:4'-phosphopantetheinyl transferase superfamily protein [Ruminococcus sp.]
MKYKVLDIKNLNEAQFELALKKMSIERQQKCLRYKFVDDRRRMAFGEELLRKLISEEYGVDESDILITNLPSGKPVAEVKGNEVFVSLTHSGNFVACALSNTPVGIDLEVKRDFNPRVLKALCDAEREFVAKSKDEAIAFLKIWTAKEAYLKMTGEGLAGFSKAEVLPLVKNGKWDGLILKSNQTEDYTLTIIYKK